MIAHAHTAYDGTRTYRIPRPLKRPRDVAYAADARGVLSLGNAYPDWRIFGSPTQPDGLFLLAAPGVDPAGVPLETGGEGWLAMDRDDVDGFAV